jgi:pimeloyl-ACP methyl ester carboxylesterase
VSQHIKNVVLVHGAFADGSGWKRVADILKKDGYKVSVAQPPETSYADDQKYTKAAIDAMGGPVVLVGHSYGGSIITEAGNHPDVAALVYIAAFALDEGESCASIETGLPQAEGSRRRLLLTSTQFKRASWLRCKSHSALLPLPAKRVRLPGKIFRPGTWLRRKTR